MRREVGLPVESMLINAADSAEWLQVNASSYQEAIPATGLREALEELQVCRKSNEA